MNLEILELAEFEIEDSKNFQALSDDEQRKVIRFLNTLRALPHPNLDVLPRIEIRLPD